VEKPITSAFRVSQKSSFNYSEEGGGSKLLRNARNKLKLTLASCLTRLALLWLLVTKSHFSYSFFIKVVNSSVRSLHINFAKTPEICAVQDITQRKVIISYRRFGTNN
jgi:hypothetical protein